MVCDRAAGAAGRTRLWELEEALRRTELRVNTLDVRSLKMFTVAEVNRMNYDEFVMRFGNIVEDCPQVAGAIWTSRPFSDVSDIQQCVSMFLDSLPYHGKLSVLRLYPELAGRVAQRGALSSESAQEHISAGLTELTDEELQKMTDLNQRYKSKFGFPFVICARQNKKQAILRGLEERLRNQEDEELRTGLEEVKKISRLRLLNIVGEEGSQARL